jgi:phosphotriesterase-related protein
VTARSLVACGVTMDRRDSDSRSLTRRQALALISASAGFAAFSADLFAQRAPSFPRGAVIRTLFKDVPPATIDGPILFHEHLSIELPPNLNPRPANAPPPPPPQPPATANVDLIIEEVKAAAKDGVRCIVDGGHADMKRSLDNLKTIATRANMLVVASGGYYMERVYPPGLATQPEDQIAAALVRDATANRYGAFGEIGENADAPMSDLERKVFRAVGKAQLRTNLPIFTHNAYGTGPNVPRDAGLRQLDVLESVGVKPERIAIGHTCCLDDPTAEVIKAIAKRGAYVGFDRVTGGRVPDEGKIKMLLAFFDAGYQTHLLLSSDSTGGRTIDAPAYNRTTSGFIPKLRAAGISDDTIRTILVDNSRRFLAFVPKQST